MHGHLEFLRELQELDIILSEAEIVHGESHKTTPVKKKAEALRARIPATVLARYDGLRRQGMAVVPLHSGMCMGCNISIPVGDLNRMRAKKTEPMCPHCGRFLLV